MNKLFLIYNSKVDKLLIQYKHFHLLSFVTNLIDNMEVEWSKDLSAELEPRRNVLESMFDNFGMDFLSLFY